MSRRRDRQLLPPDMWSKRDWREHLAEQLYQPLNKTLPPAQPAHSLVGFGGLYSTPKELRAEERTRQVDSFLAAYGVLPTAQRRPRDARGKQVDVLLGRLGIRERAAAAETGVLRRNSGQIIRVR